MSGDTSRDYCRLLEERRRIEYLDFELEIGPEAGGAYPIAVLRSPGGEPRGTLNLPFQGLELENKLQALRLALLSSSATVRRMPSPEDATVEQLGGELFDSLFAGDVRSCFDVSRHETLAAGKGLRIKLRIQAPDVATLPWEFMFDRRTGEYLSLSKYSPIVRYLEVASPVVPLNVEPPLRLLAMVASPEDLPALNVERERLRVETALEELVAAGVLEVRWILDGSWRTLQRRLDEEPWHLFHFAGHGRFDATRDEGTVALVDEHGGSAPFTATQLARMLADNPTLRLVVLNACEGAKGGSRDIFSGTASILVRRGIPAVLAMQYEIGDAAAVEFARTFYESVARGIPIDAGIAESRKAISFARGDSLEWGTPVLYTRAPDGVLFRLDTAGLPAIPAHATLPETDVTPTLPESEPEAAPMLSEPEPEAAPTLLEPESWPRDEVAETNRGTEEREREPAARQPAHRSRGPWYAAAALLVLALGGFAAWSAGLFDGAPVANPPSSPPSSSPSVEGQTLGDAALHGSYAMVMTLDKHVGELQLNELWGEPNSEDQGGMTWPAENWLFSSTCFPKACDVELTVEGRVKRAWRLTKDGREYSDSDPGVGCKMPLTRYVTFIVSGADIVDDVFTATSIQGRLTIEVTCPGFSRPERAEFELVGSLNPS